MQSLRKPRRRMREVWPGNCLIESLESRCLLSAPMAAEALAGTQAALAMNALSMPLEAEARAETSLTLRYDPNYRDRFYAELSPHSITPTNPVAFYDGDQFLGEVPFVNFVATFGTDLIPAGTRTITARYSGDDYLLPSSASVLRNYKFDSGMTLHLASPQIIAGQAATVEATVYGLGARPIDPLPAGSLMYSINGVEQSPIAVVDGMATIAIPGLASGVHEISARFEGDAYRQSTERVLQTVLYPLVIDLMVLYTPAAGGRMDIQRTIEAAVRVANGAVHVSGAAFSIRAVHIAQVNYTESGSPKTDLDRLRNPADGFLDEAHAWRDQYGADLVSLLVAHGDGLASGYANQLRRPSDPANADQAFSVVLADSAYAHNTLAHELGHNLGASHEREKGDGPGAFPFAYGYRFGGPVKYGDIMTYAGQPTTHFSNPDIKFNGMATGEAGSANNALAIQLAAPRVASYRGPRPAGIGADSRLELSVPVQQTAIGHALVLTARVVTDANVTPSGMVGLWSGGRRIGEASLTDAGLATFSFVPEALGTYAFSAAYLGDANVLADTSETLLVQGVPETASAVALTPSSHSPVTGVPCRLQARVTASSPAIPSGRVTFWRGSEHLGEAPLDADGVASLDVALSALGRCSISASYGGDHLAAPSVSTAVALTVLPRHAPVGRTVLKGGQLRGWVADANVRSRPVQVQFWIDGKRRGVMLIKARAGQASGGKRTFVWSLPALAKGQHRLQIYAVDWPTGQRVLLTERTVLATKKGIRW